VNKKIYKLEYVIAQQGGG